ncbi:transposase [Streptomyces sp. NBC_00057]|uniref:transposase n=1 Tax=Streptomyces sp. NBC_00057 TaxID=2975634 RepID=UPI00386911D0
MRGRVSRPRERGVADSGPSPADRRKTGTKHHLICDGRGTPLEVITTAANVNDVSRTLALVNSIPPIAGRRGRPRRRPDALLGDKGHAYHLRAVVPTKPARHQRRQRHRPPPLDGAGRQGERQSTSGRRPDQLL